MDDKRLRATDYRRRLPTPTSGLIADTFRCHTSSCDPFTQRNAEPMSRLHNGPRLLTPTIERRRHTKSVGMDVGGHFVSSAEPVAVDDQSLMCCDVKAVATTSGKGLWGAPYFGGDSVAIASTELVPVEDSLHSRQLTPALHSRRLAPADPIAPFTTKSSTPYAHVEERLRKEVLMLKAVAVQQGGAPQIEEQFRVYREAGHQLATQLSATAPVLGEIISAYDKYVGHLEQRCQQVTSLERERDEVQKRLHIAEDTHAVRLRQCEQQFADRLAAITSMLKTYKNVEQLTQRIRTLEALVDAGRKECAQLEEKLTSLAYMRDEFEKSVLHVEESFLTISNERDMELADYRRETLRAHESMVRVQDDCRQTVADMQMRLDAQQIALETQMQREQLSSDRARDLQLYNLTLLQQVESLKKQLSEVSSKRDTTAPADATVRIADDLGLSQLSTPRPNKAEIIARVPDLGDPSKYPSTNAIIQALLNQFDIASRRLSDADHTLNKLEERIEIVVLARAELLSREKLQKLAAAQGWEIQTDASPSASCASFGGSKSM